MILNESQFQKNSQRIDARSKDLKFILDTFEPDDEFDLCIYDYIAYLLKARSNKDNVSKNLNSLQIEYIKLLAYMLSITEEEYFILLVKYIEDMIEQAYSISFVLGDPNLLLELFESNEEMLDIKIELMSNELSKDALENNKKKIAKLSKKIQKLRNVIAHRLFEFCAITLKEHPQLKGKNIPFDLANRPLKITGDALNLDFDSKYLADSPQGPTDDPLDYYNSLFKTVDEVKDIKTKK